MFKRRCMACVLGLVAAASPAFSAVNSTASLANPMDSAGVSARALGMGGAFVGVADDASALFWNPSGLGGLQGAELALHHNSWLAGIVQETAVVGLPVQGLGAFALSINYVNYGVLEGYDETGAPSDNYSSNRYGLGLGWGKEIMPGVSAGASLKGVLQNIGDSNMSGASLDLGALWQANRQLRLGVAVANLGTPITGYSQATVVRLGGSYHVPLTTTNQLLLAASASVEPSGVNRLQVGIEDLIHSMLALRLGYQASLAETQIQGLSGMTAGLGLLYQGFGLDYAYLPFGDLGGAHRISLNYSFDRAAKSR